jgi:thiamine-monophosphate kinase
MGQVASRGILIPVPVGEKKLIQQIRRGARRGPAVATGIGDDCAVLRVPRGHELLVTTDFSIENVHFRRDWHPPELVGRRCLTRGLSDIAAMGGEPLAAFLSLAVASDVPQKWVDRFLKGLLDLANEFKVPLAGGDTAQSEGGMQADIVVVGSAPKGKAVLRSGAKPGDLIYVTGELGGAAAKLAEMKLAGTQLSGAFSAESCHPSSRHFDRHSDRHPDPRALQPRLSVGQSLRRRGMASAMIDVSDGLSTDLEHICQESRVGAEIGAVAIPRAQVGSGRRVALEFALHGGDDYELLFTSAAKIPSRIVGVGVTEIGRITRGAGMRLVDADGQKRRLEAEGWEHFAGNS